MTTSVYFSNQDLGVAGQGDFGGINEQLKDVEEMERKFMIFLQETQERNTFIYREQLQKNAREGHYFINVDMQLLMNFDYALADKLRTEPDLIMPALESATKKVYLNNYHEAISGGASNDQCPNFQVQIHSEENPKMLRDLTSGFVGRLIVVPGIVTSASRSAIKATLITYRCHNCGHEFSQTIKHGFGGAAAPRECAQKKSAGLDKQQCPLDPYRVVPEKCIFIDQQTLKLQEAPELIPTGEMPRTYILTVDRELTDKVTPGNRIKIVGILAIMQQSQGGVGASGQANRGVNKPYIRVLGIQSQENKGNPSAVGFAMPNISQEDEEKFIKFSRDPKVYDKITSSIASAIYGHPDIKKAVACLLFGGSPKRLADGMKLRGDINVLLLGDPSVAKSQFLKFVERAAPIAVYTSGKGVSAAGLTAAVLKDNATGEFQLEGGAMVLADGGVVCIDEFDKMRPQDRVAIHEAMEQQTISIAKAGITTILNSRTSVLAAANPLMGRYDDLKHASEQIDFQSSILSRFDTIFIVRDKREESIDKAIATHVLNLHMNKIQASQNSADISIDDLKKYLTYAKIKIFPRLSEEAGSMLQDLYVSDRMKSKQQQVSSKSNGIPITVRQLEAIIRISESIAKMHLQSVVTAEHVHEAHRLFKISTLNAAASGMSANNDQTPVELQRIVSRIEEAIRRRVAIGTKISFPNLVREMLNRFDNERAIGYAIMAMVKRDEFVHHEGRKILERKC